MATVQDQIRRSCAWMIVGISIACQSSSSCFVTNGLQIGQQAFRLARGQLRHPERFGREIFPHVRDGEGQRRRRRVHQTTDLRTRSIEAINRRPTIGKWNGTSSGHRVRERRTSKNAASSWTPSGRAIAHSYQSRKVGAHVTFVISSLPNVIFDGYFTRFSSQVRGVSPLTTAINLIQDAYEGVDFNLAKAKVHAIFGLAIMRDFTGFTDQEEVAGWGGASGVKTGATENEKTAETSTDGTKSITASLQEIKPNEMMLVDMDTKGRLDTIGAHPIRRVPRFTAM